MNDTNSTQLTNSEKDLNATALASELRFGIEALHTHTYALLEKVEELVELYTRSIKQ